MSEVVLVTETEYRKAEDVFRGEQRFTVELAPAAEEALAALVRARGARVAVVGNEFYLGALYEALADVAGGRGALLARFGVGHDGVDKPLARAHGIIVTNTPGTLDASVAEHTLWLIGALVKRMGFHEARMRAGAFEQRRGIELCGKTLGIIGLGSIGRRVAAMAHFGFGMRVIAAGAASPEELERRENRPLAEALAALGVERYTADMDEVLSEAEIVTLHLPSNAATRKIMDARRLARMKPAAMLVNTARGAVLDEVALYDALSEGRLAAAALDVFEVEPYQPAAPDKDLRTLENIVLTPHIGSNTAEANQRMGESCTETAGKFLAGRLEGLPRVD